MNLHEIVGDLFDKFPELRPRRPGHAVLFWHRGLLDQWEWWVGNQFFGIEEEFNAKAHIESSLMDALPEGVSIGPASDGGTAIYKTQWDHVDQCLFTEMQGVALDRLTALVAAIRAAKEAK